MSTKDDKETTNHKDKKYNEIPSGRFVVFGMTAINRGLMINMIVLTNYFYFKDMTNDKDKARFYTSKQSVLYHIGAISSYMLTGFLLDKFGGAKMFIVLFNFTHAIAMAIYSIPVPAAALYAPLLSGLSSASVIVVHYSLTMNVSYKQMGKYLTWVSLSGNLSSFGTILVVFVYPRIDTYIGRWHIWQGNLPGITMFFTYMLAMLFCFCCYDRKSRRQQKDDQEKDDQEQDDSEQVEKQCLMDEKNEANGTPNKMSFKEKLSQHFSNSAVLFSSFDTTALMLHGVFLASVRTSFEVLIPIAVSECFGLDASMSVLVVSLSTFPLAIMWFILPFILKKVSYYTLLLVFTFGILCLLFVQCFLDDKSLCFMAVVTFYYISTFIVPAVRTLMVSIIGYTTPVKVLGTAHSTYEMTLKFSGMLGALLVGYFAHHIRILCAIELTIGLLSTLCLILRRHKLSRPVEKNM